VGAPADGGSGGGAQVGAIKLVPGAALRLRTTLPTLHTRSAKISGWLEATFGEAPHELSDGAPVFYPNGGYARVDAAAWEEEARREIVIAPLGASVDGGPVRAYEPLGFLPGWSRGTR
jgi:hypothetical protein